MNYKLYAHPIQGKKGFTLIELLVVIAIIAILAAILFPVFSRARENARRSSCASNLKQLGLGVLQYVQDYDETYPTVYDSGVSAWPIMIFPYVKSEQVYFCPSFPSAKYNSSLYGRDGGYGMTWTATGFVNLGYVSFGSKDSGSYDGGKPVKQAQLAKTSDCVLLGETNNGSSIGIPYLYNGATSPDRWVPTNVEVDARHLEGLNFAFADGHVKWGRKDKMQSETRHWLFNPA